MDNDEYFEGQWKKAFEDRSEMPPESVWKKIEAQLNKQDDEAVVVLPWWRNLGWVAGVAAAVGLLLVAGIAWQFLPTPSKVETLHCNVSTNNVATNNAKQSTSANPKNAAKIAKTGEADAISDQDKSDNNTPSFPTVSTPFNVATLHRNVVINNIATNNIATNNVVMNNVAKNNIAINNVAANNVATNNIATNNVTTNNVTTNNTTLQYNVATDNAPKMQITALTGKGLKPLIGLAARQPWVSYSAPSNVSKPKRSAKIYWAALSLLPTRFNAGLQIPRSSYNFTSSNFASISPANPPKEQSHVATSVAVQSQVGVGLGKRWSLETGIGYLRGRSVYEATTYIDQQTGLVSNSLETAIANSPQTGNLMADASKNSAPLSISSSNRLTPLAQQAVGNQYDYLQIPLQVGYAVVQSRRKLSFWVLGGFANTILLHNQFENGQGEAVNFGTNKGAFRTFSVAASGGGRLQYQFAARWSATMTGNYQHSLMPTTYSETTLTARPWWWSVGCGLQYGF